MKKTISINIAGLVFHIEEDGFDKLRTYLNSIQRYFANYEDSKEIISDIEGRVAERFLNKQKADDKQAISLHDVDELIKAMGSVTDFEAVEEEEDLAGNRPTATAPIAAQQPAAANQQQQSNPKTPPNSKSKPLVRDTKRKLLGGVCAGIAHYLNVDTLLTRLVFLFLFLGIPAVGGIIGHGVESVFGPVSGIVFLLYLALWVSFPSSTTLEEDKSIKKFYRDSEQKVVGGVAAGVAAYFGIDVGIVRLLWVLSVAFFGTGLLLYLVLWSIAPLAKTLTEKMEMTGQPITLENIETNVKKALQPDTTEENTFTKLLLLPFRAIAAVFRGLTPMLGFLVVLARILGGVLLVIIGGSVLTGLLVALFAMLGMTELPSWGFENDSMPLNFFLGEVSSVAYVFLFLAIAVPFAAVAWAGISLLARENKFSTAVWQTMLGLFLVGIVGASAYTAKYGSSFRRNANVTQTKDFVLTSNKALLLDLNENDADQTYRNMSFDLLGHDANNAQLAMELRAQGRSRTDAEANARTVLYGVSQKDSALVFDEHFTLANEAKFRAQRLNVKFYLPYNRPFAMTKAFFEEFGNRNLDGREYAFDGMNDSEWRRVRWVIKPDSGLVCLNRALITQTPDENDDEESQELGSVSVDIDQAVESTLGSAFEESFDQDTRGEFVKQFEVKYFDKISINGAYVVKILRGDAIKVTADGRESDIEKLQVRAENNTLKIENEAKFGSSGNNKRIGLTITLPTIKSLGLAGATVAQVKGFNNLNDLEVEITGASKTLIDANAQLLDLSVSGASKVVLRGKANTLKADLAGACEINAEAMQIQSADVSAVGASRANLGKIPKLKSITLGASKVERLE